MSPRVLNGQRKTNSVFTTKKFPQTFSIKVRADKLLTWRPTLVIIKNALILQGNFREHRLYITTAPALLSQFLSSLFRSTTFYNTFTYVFNSVSRLGGR